MQNVLQQVYDNYLKGIMLKYTLNKINNIK